MQYQRQFLDDLATNLRLLDQRLDGLTAGLWARPGPRRAEGARLLEHLRTQRGELLQRLERAREDGCEAWDRAREDLEGRWERVERTSRAMTALVGGRS